MFGNVCSTANNADCFALRFWLAVLNELAVCRIVVSEKRYIVHSTTRTIIYQNQSKYSDLYCPKPFLQFITWLEFNIISTNVYLICIWYVYIYIYIYLVNRFTTKKRYVFTVSRLAPSVGHLRRPGRMMQPSWLVQYDITGWKRRT